MSQSTDDKLNRFLSLQQDWDGYGGLPISQSAVDGAKTLIAVLERLGVPEPAVVPAGDGIVVLEWSQNGVDLTLEVRSIDDIVVVGAEVVS